MPRLSSLTNFHERTQASFTSALRTFKIIGGVYSLGLTSPRLFLHILIECVGHSDIIVNFPDLLLWYENADACF